MRRALLTALFAVCVAIGYGQEVSGVVRDSSTRKALDFVSVVIYDKKRQPISFRHTDEKGRFSLPIPAEKEAESISFTMLGYGKKTFRIAGFHNGQSVFLKSATTKIREVTVRSKRLQLSNDTLTYSVAGFKQKQDRSIADVIAKMPGLSVNPNGSISYQGKAINKFYIEGLDLMGKRYSMASKNLSASKVKSVQVLQNHQPIKTLKHIQFSEQAALNLVLTDDAKNTWNGGLEVGAGSRLQHGVGPAFLRDGKLLAMVFSKKKQSLSMYKWNNTGKDIQQEVQSLASGSALDGQSSAWVRDISIGGSDLKAERHHINDTHIIATNWLTKIGKEGNLRWQSTYLFDKTRARKYNQTIYSDIFGRPAIEEESDVNKYRSEFTSELQYKQNTDKRYLNNTLRTFFDWNHAGASAFLNHRNVAQYVRPHKVFIGDAVSFLKNVGHHRTFGFNLSAFYQNQPGLLALLDSTTQRLVVARMKVNASTSFRHKLFGFNIIYNAGINYDREEARLGQDTQERQFLEQISGVLTPQISYMRNGLALSAAVPLRLVRQDWTFDRQTHFYAEPQGRISYQLAGATDANLNYRRRYSLYSLESITTLPYYTSYISRVYGTGTLGENIRTDNLWVNLNYGNPMTACFIHLTADYAINHHLPLYEHKLVGEVYETRATGRHTQSNRWMLSAEISKAFGMGKLTFNLGSNAMWNNYRMLLSDRLVPYQLQGVSSYLKVSLMPVPVFSLEEKSTFAYSRQINKWDHSLNSVPIRTFLHELRLFWMPRNWRLEWVNELYHSNDRSMNTAYFSDAELSYRTRKYECSLMLNNLFGTRLFKHHYVTDSYIHYTVTHLRSREVIAKISFYF